MNLVIHRVKDKLKACLLFRTFAIPQLTELWNLFYIDGVKTITPGLVLNYVDELAFAYWVMCDGSRQDSRLILHWQDFTAAENHLISEELNTKFGLSSKVIDHKKKYTVILFSTFDAARLRQILLSYRIDSMLSKLPLILI